MRRRLDVRALRRLTLPAQTERFCLALIENGGDLASAVRLAFPDFANGTRHTVLRRGRLLMAQPEVQERLQELGQRAADVAGIDRDYLLRRLKQIADASPAHGPSAASVKALELLAKMTGEYTESREVHVSLSNADEKDLLHRLSVLTERAERLGIGVPPMRDITPQPRLIEG